jgi:hypothetical protein
MAYTQSARNLNFLIDMCRLRIVNRNRTQKVQMMTTMSKIWYNQGWQLHIITKNNRIELL